jgi:hypothetical protein
MRGSSAREDLTTTMSNPVTRERGSRGLIGGLVVATAAFATIVFAGVAIHELNYASVHPYAYGPAKVIAWAGGAGALLSIAVGALGFTLTRSDSQ